MRLRILPAARVEIEEAAEWYEAAREGLAIADLADDVGRGHLGAAPSRSCEL